MKIEVKNIPEYSAAFIFYKGSYDKIPEVLGRVVEWLMTKNVEIQMPVYGTYFNSPLEVDEDDLEWEMGTAFKGTLQAEEDIQIKVVPEQTVVSTVFKGPYGEASSVYVDLFQYAEKEGYQIIGPVTEVYMNSPEYVPESELLTEVQFPVVKK